VLFTRACRLVPPRVSHRTPDMSIDMRLFVVSDETAGSDRSEPMAMGLSDALA
jgi:hypothetical protein